MIMAATFATKSYAGNTYSQQSQSSALIQENYIATLQGELRMYSNRYGDLTRIHQWRETDGMSEVIGYILVLDKPIKVRHEVLNDDKIYEQAVTEITEIGVGINADIYLRDFADKRVKITGHIQCYWAGWRTVSWCYIMANNITHCN